VGLCTTGESGDTNRGVQRNVDNIRGHSFPRKRASGPPEHAKLLMGNRGGTLPLTASDCDRRYRYSGVHRCWSSRCSRREPTRPLTQGGSHDVQRPCTHAALAILEPPCARLAFPSRAWHLVAAPQLCCASSVSVAGTASTVSHVSSHMCTCSRLIDLDPRMALVNYSILIYGSYDVHAPVCL